MSSNIVCQYKKNNTCLISSKIANKSVLAQDDACRVCLSCDIPKQVNNVTASLALSSYPPNDLKRAEILNQYFVHFLSPGVGTELHKLLEKRGFKIESGCPCLPMINRMNSEGPGWCRENIKIITISMREEYNRRFPNSVIPNFLKDRSAKTLVKRAIKNYESKKTPSKISSVSG